MTQQKSLNEELVKLAQGQVRLIETMQADIVNLQIDRDACLLLIKLLIASVDVTTDSAVSTALKNQLREQLNGSQPHGRSVLERCISILP